MELTLTRGCFSSLRTFIEIMSLWRMNDVRLIGARSETGVIYISARSESDRFRHIWTGKGKNSNAQKIPLKSLKIDH